MKPAESTFSTSSNDEFSQFKVYTEAFNENFTETSLDQLDEVKVCQDPKNIYFDYRVMTCDVSCREPASFATAHCVYSVRVLPADDCYNM